MARIASEDPGFVVFETEDELDHLLARHKDLEMELSAQQLRLSPKGNGPLAQNAAITRALQRLRLKLSPAGELMAPTTSTFPLDDCPIVPLGQPVSRSPQVERKKE